jgi:hypothetical protein
MYLWMRLQLYQVKSWVVRYFTEHTFKTYPVKRYSSIAELERAMSRLTWTGDTWRQGWDAISYPGRVQALIDAAHAELGVDCDEFGVYEAYTLRRSLEDGVLKDAIRNPLLLTLGWLLPNGKPEGHNVCYMEMPDGRVAFMDYRMPVSAGTKQELVRKIINIYGGRDAVCVGWTLSDPDTLAPVEVHWR